MTDHVCTCGHTYGAHSVVGDHGCLADIGAATDANPRGCRCEKFERRRSERDITADVDAIEARLAELYAERRGHLIEPQPQCDPETGDFLGPCWGWCSNCGKTQVDAAQGYDTCGSCMEGA